MNVEFANLELSPQTQIQLNLSLTAEVNISRSVAQRRVSRFLIDQVGGQLYGEQPTLVMGETILWRVPVWLALQSTGPLGTVGTLDVNATTGEILFTQKILDTIADHADRLATYPTSKAVA